MDPRKRQNRQISEGSINPKPYTLHPTPYTLYPTPYTLCPMPYAYTLHSTPYTLHPTPYTLCPMHLSPFTLHPYTLRPYTLHPPPSTLTPYTLTLLHPTPYALTPYTPYTLHPHTLHPYTPTPYNPKVHFTHWSHKMGEVAAVISVTTLVYFFISSELPECTMIPSYREEDEEDVVCSGASKQTRNLIDGLLQWNCKSMSCVSPPTLTRTYPQPYYHNPHLSKPVP